MMAGEHPSEAALFAYVEDELEGDERATVDTHLAVCETCANQVALVRQGREALRAWPLLERPSGMLERLGLGLGLPRQDPPARPRRRWLTIALPAAAAVAVVAGVATLSTGDGSGNGAPRDAAVAEEAGPQAGESAGEDALAETSDGEARRFARVAGEPDAIARDLRRRGFEARVRDDAVVVRTDRLAALERALAELPPGPVEIRVE